MPRKRNSKGPSNPLQASSSGAGLNQAARGVRQASPLQLETYTADTGAAALDDKDADTERTVEFFSGNPYVEKTVGIMHLYKENVRTNLASAAPSVTAGADADVEGGRVQRSTMLCLLAVPARISCQELLQFLSPVCRSVKVMRIIRNEATPSQYMVLVHFKSQTDADLFYRTYNGAQYNSIEPDLCHLAYVSKVSSARDTETQLRQLSPEGHTELPTCPVCLERMDESVDGILTILCNHSFHGSCLAQWGDTTCPVCRYCQTPELLPEHKCMSCGKQDDLWICLICGHIGCGRYEAAHAHQHFSETSHTFSLQVGTQRVWDYAGDNYVHRLIQSKGDGKVVEYEPNNPNPQDEEKLETITLEYTYLLTNQLESQRLFFEEKLATLQSRTDHQMSVLVSEQNELKESLSDTRNELKQIKQDKLNVERKLQATNSKLQKVQHELKDEQELNKQLRGEQTEWSQQVNTLNKQLAATHNLKDKQVADLEEQLRDLMFHFEAQTKLSEAPEGEGQKESSTMNVSAQEIRDSTVHVASNNTHNTPNNKHKRKSHK